MTSCLKLKNINWFQLPRVMLTFGQGVDYANKDRQQTTRLCDLKIRSKMLHKTCNIKAVQDLFSGENNVSVNCCRKRFLLLGTKQLCPITNKFQEIWRHHLYCNCDSRKINSTYELTWAEKSSCLCGCLSFVGLLDY